MSRIANEELERGLTMAENAGRHYVPKTKAEHLIVARRVRDGRLFSPHPGVYARSVWDAPEFCLRNAACTVRTLAKMHPDWIFTSFSAALIYGLWVPYYRCAPICIAQPTCGYAQKSEPIAARRLKHIDVRVEAGVRVTSLSQTLFECAIDAPASGALPVIDSAYRFRRKELDGLWNFVNAHAKGRHGNARARMTLASASGRAESGGESMVRGRIIEEGFMPPTVLQAKFIDPLDHASTMRVDMLWELPGGRRVIGEVDGMIKYTDTGILQDRTAVDALVDERQRESRLNALGLPVMRFLVKRAFEPGYIESVLRAFDIPLAE